MSLGTVLKLMEPLTAAELQQVRIKLNMLLATVTGAQAETDDWLLEALYAELARRGLHMKGHRFPLMRVRDWAPSYEAEGATVRALLLQHVPCRRASQRAALGRLAARSLADFLAPAAPICLRVLLRNVAKVPEAVDHAFPGYMEAGMLAHVLMDSAASHATG